ncbi:MAG TPA: peptide deformylase [Clostridiales bacterium]|nr:peptide deformylase [Clostridiales bacterium]
MAIREIRVVGDEILRKKARRVDKIDDRIKTILDDMIETMHKSEGVGLAAPQVGILRKLVVIDLGDGVIELINPEIVEQEGEAIDQEGCLSVPGVTGKVLRPARVKVKAVDRNNKPLEIEGTDLLARALCHEIDHLHGILFIDKIITEEGEQS